MEYVIERYVKLLETRGFHVVAASRLMNWHYILVYVIIRLWLLLRIKRLVLPADSLIAYLGTISTIVGAFDVFDIILTAFLGLLSTF